MVDVKELKGWEIDTDTLEMIKECRCDEGEGAKYFFNVGGIRRKTVYECGYCGEGYHYKREDAEKCCEEVALC